MPFFTWNETYSVGIKTFDEHHQQLIALLNQLHGAMKEGKGNQELRQILDSLVKYTSYHFSSEEKELLRYQYPGYLKHLKEHEALKGKVLDFQLKMSNGGMGMSIPLAEFLKAWLANHILGEDKKYGAFLQAKGLQ